MLRTDNFLISEDESVVDYSAFVLGRYQRNIREFPDVKAIFEEARASPVSSPSRALPPSMQKNSRSRSSSTAAPRSLPRNPPPRSSPSPKNSPPPRSSSTATPTPLQKNSQSRSSSTATPTPLQKNSQSRSSSPAAPQPSQKNPPPRTKKKEPEEAPATEFVKELNDIVVPETKKKEKTKKKESSSEPEREVSKLISPNNTIAPSEKSSTASSFSMYMPTTSEADPLSMYVSSRPQPEGFESVRDAAAAPPAATPLYEPSVQTEASEITNIDASSFDFDDDSIDIDALSFDFDAEYFKLNLPVRRRKPGARKTDPKTFVFESEQSPESQVLTGGTAEDQLGVVERVNISNARMPRSDKTPCPLCGASDGSVTEANLGIWARGAFRNDLVYGNESGFEAFALLERYIKEIR